MFTFFKYIDYALKAKQGYEKPDELMTDLSFGVVEGYFMLSFVFLVILTGSSFWLGFISGYLFFKILFFVFLSLLIFAIFIFRLIKRTIAGISKNITNKLNNRIKRKNTIDVEIKK